jgi:hypothetical protein
MKRRWVKVLVSISSFQYELLVIVNDSQDKG